ncbi:MAG TPA: tetratricopeptide repeat protein [Actinomycetota bacterium]|nr:tetratricopeptide repeat protein [Actinomycetota bacterium]
MTDLEGRGGDVGLEEDGAGSQSATRRNGAQDLPSGTVTLLLTDIEGSTKLWTERPRAMFQAVSRHHAIIGNAIERRGGMMPRDQGEGDSIFAAFPRASDAVAAAVAIQLALQDEPWPEGVALRVRLALHTGEPRLADGNYFGQTVSRCARLRGLANGGQTLLSSATMELVRDDLPPGASGKDLGTHRLKDFARPEAVYQLTHPDLPDNFPPLHSDDARADNLPLQLTTFVGREQEITEIKDLLASIRLVTLVGTGGCGKTRLAIEVGRQLLAEFEDGVHLVALASLSDSSLVVSRIAQSVGLQESAGEAPFDGLANFLRDKHMLLMLDNFEGVIEAAALISELLTKCPDIKVLATTRASLRVSSEHEFQVPPLELPELDYLPDIVELSRHSAVKLFVERAQAIKADFALTNANARIIAEICHRLDGLPLAIELAAVRVKLLPPAVLLDRLSSRLDLLTGGPRDLPARQQTLRNAIDWDYTLLEPEEQTLFRRLAVCRGGLSLDAATAVATAAGEIGLDLFDGLDSLVGKSLLRQVPSLEDEPRFGMLQTIREYALDVLDATDESDATRQAHANFYLGLAERASERLRGPDQVRWLEALEFDHDNLQDALEWSKRNDDWGVLLRLTAGMSYFWSIRGYVSEGRLWTKIALERTEGIISKHRARVLAGGAMLARARVDYEEARRLLEESIEAQRQLGDEAGVAFSIKDLGNLEVDQGNIEGAEKLYSESLAEWRRLEDREGIAQTLNNLGFIAQIKGDQTEAMKLLDESLVIFRQLRDKQGIARALMNIAVSTRELGDYERAVRLSRESLVLWRQLGDKWDVADCLEDLAGELHELGLHYQAAVLYGGAEALRWAIGAPRPPVEQDTYQRRVDEVHNALGDAGFSECWARGSGMRMEEVIDYALHDDRRRGAGSAGPQNGGAGSAGPQNDEVSK